MSERTVLYGGAGFIGCALARHLYTAGSRVRIVDSMRRLARARPWLINIPLETAQPDADPQTLFAGCDHLVHLAWSSIPATSMVDPAGDVQANVAGSIALFEKAIGAGIQSLLFASSGGAVYGDIDGLADETVAPNPISIYGINKLAVEHVLALYGQQRGVRTYSLRISNAYGPYQLEGTPVGAIANFVAKATAGKRIEVWGDGTVARDFIHIDDVCRAVLSVLAKQPDPGCYNVGSSEATSLNLVLDTIHRLSPRRPKVTFTAKRGFDVGRIALDAGRLTRATGWHPTIGLECGIESLIERAMAMNEVSSKTTVVSAP